MMPQQSHNPSHGHVVQQQQKSQEAQEASQPASERRVDVPSESKAAFWPLLIVFGIVITIVDKQSERSLDTVVAVMCCGVAFWLVQRLLTLKREREVFGNQGNKNAAP